ncbi:hypothetical protein K7X08_010762 [Anisodus acutangulus]|uniref:Uncharacterized protein n=1 Tax=Anisodus acutangulus TaxID=402998 RepID=A0A9Q1RAH9_9SOLA|nr:hypothetical protein K7X08_010762 [Anisodus acutangulus]
MTAVDISSTYLVYMSLQNYHSDDGIYRNCNVKISCPNLKVLKYSAQMAKDIILENLFSIEVVDLFIDDFDDLRKEIGMCVHKMIKNVPSISALKLCLDSILGYVDEDCMQVMMLLLKHSPSLEVLDLFSYENFDWDENWKMHDPSDSIVCLESSLNSEVD